MSREPSPAVTTLRTQLRALPKVDLHRHLEGSLRLQTLADIAQEHGIDLPSYDIEQLRPFVTVTNGAVGLTAFLRKFELLHHLYRTQAAVERVAYEAVADAAADNIKYLELRFNPVALSRVEGFPLAEVTAWVCDAVAQAAGEYDVRVGLILTIRRDAGFDTASEILDVALAHREKGVVAIDLAGDETNYPADHLSAVFQRARREGLSSTVHAGEAGGAGNVRKAIEQFGAQRIGHGVHVIQDPAVVQLALREGTTFEVCPTSNLVTGVAGVSAPHPLAHMLRVGLRVTINTDDPSICDTTLTDEYVVAMLAMGLRLDHIRRAIVTAAEDSFAPPDERQELADRLRQELALA